MAKALPVGASRLPALDALRGLIMVVMALDHARAFVAREHPFEYWGAALPHYDSALPFITRLVTHLCAPGFFFLMGVGMTLLAASRRPIGWSERRIAGYFFRRGVVLLLVEQLLENPAWLLGSLGAAASNAPEAALLPSGEGPALVFGVLFGLAMSMILWSPLTRLPTLAIGALSMAAIIVTQLAVPPISQAEVAFSPLLRLLLIPGNTGVWFVLYPVIPWVGLTGLGIAFGREVGRNPDAIGQLSLRWGTAALVMFLVVRTIGGFGNIHVPVPPGWIGFLNLTKYPPSLAFVLLTLGVNLLLLAAFAADDARLARSSRVLLIFGRTALFFYIVHLYVYALIGFAFPHGASIPTVYPMWLLGLLILYPLCVRYERFKYSTPPDSLWRLF